MHVGSHNDSLHTATEVRSMLCTASSTQSTIGSMQSAISPFDSIIGLLEEHGASYRVVEHAPEGRSAQISAIRGNKPEEACKALAIRAKATKKSADRTFLLLCFPSHLQTDFDLLGYGDVRLCSQQELLELTGCVPGAVPPFSFHPQLQLVLDPRQLEHETMWFNAGRLDRSIALATADYRRIVAPTLRSITH